jgi:hypothetical protein
MSFISGIKVTSGASVGDIVKKTYGPLDALEKNKINVGTSLRYPLDVGDTDLFPHTVEFQCWRPRPAVYDKPEDRNGGVNDAGKFAREEIVGVDPNKLAHLSLFGNGERGVSTLPKNLATLNATGPRVNVNQQYTPRVTDWQRRVEAAELIAMYLPPAAWNDNIANQYRSESLTSALGMAGVAIEAGGSFMNANKEDQSLTGSLSNLFTEIGIKWVAPFVGGDARVLADVGLQMQGYAANPQFEILYDSTEYRSFQFDFYLTPRNSKEAYEVLNIIRAFKFHASPEYTTGAGRFLIPPSIFDITFKYKGTENKKLPLISTCALEGFDCNYSGGLDQWATFTDGMPIQIQMILRFRELELIHKRLRQEGY